MNKVVKELQTGDEVTIKWHRPTKFAGYRGTIKNVSKLEPHEYLVVFPPVREGFASLERTFLEDDFVGYGDYE